MHGIPTKPTEIFIALAWIAFLLYWVISAVWARPAKKFRNVAFSLLMIAAVVGLFLLFSHGIVSDDFNVVLWPGTIIASAGADVLVLTGLLVFVWARRSLGSNWSSSAAMNHERELVQVGPYVYVRHPIYSGFLIMVLGTALAYGRLVGIVILGISIAGLTLKALKEESLLTKQFGDRYVEYKSRTKAMIPYLL
jgi:protein-S-isoprenylcysteine O-methyltransferase Ste14